MRRSSSESNRIEAKDNSSSFIANKVVEDHGEHPDASIASTESGLVFTLAAGRRRHHKETKEVKRLDPLGGLLDGKENPTHSYQIANQIRSIKQSRIKSTITLRRVYNLLVVLVLLFQLHFKTS